VITFSIWMIWCMKNYARFHDKIEVFKAIFVIKDLTCLEIIHLKLQWRMIYSISMCSSFLVLTLVLVEFYVIYLLDGSFLRQAGFKLTLLGLLGIIQVLSLVEVFFVGVYESLLEFSLRFLTFRLFWLLNFMELYMLLRKLRSWDLLMFGWNVTRSWFVLRLLLGQMFLWCFVIDWILVLITVEKSSLGLLIFFVKGMCVLISGLI